MMAGPCRPHPIVQMWQMYNSARPYYGLQHGQIIMAVVSQQSLLTFPATAPADFVQMANACMAFKAEDRPTFEQVMKMIRAMQDK